MKLRKEFLKKLLSLAVSAAMLINSSAVTFAESEPAPVEAVTSVNLIEPESRTLDGLGSIDDIGEPILSFFGMRPGAAFGTSYYEQLDDDSKAIYDALKTFYADGSRTDHMTVNVTAEEFTVVMIASTTLEDDVNKTTLSLKEASTNDIYAWVESEVIPARLALLYDHPEMSWLVNARTSYRYTGFTYDQADIINLNGENDVSASASGVEFWLSQNYNDTGDADDIEGAITTAKAAINAAIGNSTDPYDIVKGINDYLCDTVTYNDDAVTDGIYTDDQLRCYQTAYSAFFKCNGDTEITTVCAGYAKAFKVLCDSYGIPCVYVSGQAGSTPSSMGPHGWNYVQMDDDKWYAVDATWADQEGSTGTIYDFFLVGSDTPAPHFSNSTFSATHVASGVLNSNYTYTFTYPTLSTAAYEPGAPVEKTDISTAVATQSNTLTYSGSNLTPEFTVTLDETPLVKGTDYTVTFTAQKNAGTYSATIEGTGDYEGSVEASWTIGKADATIPAQPAAKNSTYNGQPQALVVAGTANGGTLEYSLDQADWSAEIPTGTDAGSYTVYAKVKGDSNHNDSVIVPVSVTIAKRPVTITIESKTIETTENVPVLGHSITDGSLATGHSLSLYCEFEMSEYAPGDGVPGNYTYGPSAGYPQIKDSSSNDVTANYDITVTKGVLSIVEHEHSWTYDRSGDTITARCITGTCDIITYPTVTLNPPSNLTFDYTEKKASLTIEDEYGAFDGLDNSYITYTDVNDTNIGTIITDVGTYKAMVWFESSYAEIDFTILPKNLSDITEPHGVPRIYTGEEQEVTISFPDSDCPYAITYLTEGTDFTITGGTSAATDAGTYTVQLTGKGNYTGTVEASWTIDKNTIDSAVFLDSNGDEVVFEKEYDGTTAFNAAEVAKIRFNDLGEISAQDLTLTVNSADAAVGSTKALTVVITLSESMKNNFTSASYNISTTGKITKTRITVDTPPAALENLVYNGAAQTLISAGSVTDGTMMYSLNQTDWSAEFPKATDAGTHTVYYKAVPDDTESLDESETGEISVVIAPFNLADAYVEGTTETGFNGTSQSVCGDWTVRFSNGGTIIPGAQLTMGNTVSAVNAGTYTVTISSESQNFTGTLDKTWTINKAKILNVTGFFDAEGDEVEIVKEYDGTTDFDDSSIAAIRVELATGEEMTLSVPTEAEFDITFDSADVGTTLYHCSVSINQMEINFDDGAYTCPNYGGEIILARAKVITAPEAKTGLVYDGTEHLLTTEGVAEGGSIKFAIENGGILNWSDQIPVATDAGEYKIYYKVTGDANHSDSLFDKNTDFVIVTIAKKTPVYTAPVAIENLIYSSEPQTLMTAGSTDAGQIWYSVSGSTFSTTPAEATDAGTYIVYWKIVGDNNIRSISERSFTVTISKKNATVKADDKSKTYGENDPALTATITGLAGSDAVTADVTREQGDDAGTYTITATCENSNYNFTFEDGVFTINKAIPDTTSIPEPAASDITYGQTLSESILESGWKWTDEDYMPSVGETCEAYYTVDDKNYDYTGVTGYDPARHAIVMSAFITINKADVTVKADDKFIIVGAALPEATYSVTGLADGESLTKLPTIGYSGADNMTVGEYEIVVSGAEASANYNIIHKNGKLYVGLCDHADTKTLKFDGSSHWYDCTKCGASELSKEEHDGGTATCTTKAKCTVCNQEYGTVDSSKHNVSATWAYDTDGHWHNCECGTKFDSAAHSGGTATCTKQAVCEICKIPYGKAKDHSWKTEWSYNSTNHWYDCSNPDCTVKNSEGAHVFGDWEIVIQPTSNSKGLRKRSCECGYEYTEEILPGNDGGEAEPPVTMPSVTTTTSGWNPLPVETTTTASVTIPSFIVTTSSGWVPLPTETTTTPSVTIPSFGSSTTSGWNPLPSETTTTPSVTVPTFGSSATSGWNPVVPSSTTSPSVTGTTPDWSPSPVATTTSAATTTTRPADEDEIIDDDIYEDDDEPQIKGDNGKMGWDAIADEIADAEDGDTVTVDMNGSTELPEEIIEQIQGKDIDLVIELENGAVWTINGESVTDPSDIDLGVEFEANIPVKVINEVTDECEYITISLAHDGDFGFTAVLTVNMGDENEGLYANLYWYTDGDTEFICSDKIDSKGDADLTFTHASEYVIVIDEENHGKRAEESTDEEIVVEDEDDDSNPFTAVTISFTGVIISAAAVALSKKRRK